MNDVSIRRFKEADASAVNDLVRGLQQAMNRWFDRNLPIEALDDAYMAQLFGKVLDNGAIFVAEKNGGIVGYAMMTLGNEGDSDEVSYTYAEVLELMVVPDQRGAGIGEALLDVCERHSKESGETWMRIAILAGNEGAHRLYQRHGFKDHIVILEKPVGAT